MADGRVILAGAGPGDPGLLTVTAAEAIATADVILHDRLIPVDALAGARPDAIVIDVGKTGGGHQVPQEETERLIVEHAAAGRTVLRLKGGDPFVFGRGGEEAQLCHEHGIPFSVIPGVTAGIAAPAYAGIPVTHRGVAPGVAFVTAHESAEKPGTQVDWAGLARFPGTLVFYMGVRALPRVTASLIEHGRSADEPAAIIERGTYGDQRSVHGALETIAALAAEHRIGAPAVTVVGDVAALGEKLAWRGSGPLAGVSIAVTRPAGQASALAAALAAEGARVIEAPVIRTEPLPFTLPDDLDAFDLAVFSSPNGVDAFFGALAAAGRDSRALAGVQIAVIGPGTARALARHGITADLVPDRAVGESLAELLVALTPRAAIITRAHGGRDVVRAALEAGGAPRIEIVEPYRTIPVALDDQMRERVLGADWATVTSASSARALAGAAGGAALPRLASIGPVTSAQLRELGLEPALEAREHTPAGLVAAILGAVERG